jgi:hypothetical protein
MMNEHLKKIDEKEINKISSFAHQIKAIKELKHIYDETENNDRAVASTMMSNENTTVDMDQTKLEFIKRIPKIQIEQLGFGNLNEVLSQDDDFLSQSSVSQKDFEILLNDNFFDHVSKLQLNLN